MTNTLSPQQAIAAKRANDYAVKSVSVDGKAAASDVTVIDVDTTTRTVTGLYNTALFFDSDYDVILPGANEKSIRERGPDSSATQKIKHLMDHEWDTDKMPGRIVTLDERKVTYQGQQIHGTYFEMKCARTPIGDTTLVNYLEKVYDNHSEGFRFLAGEYVEKGSDEWNKWIQMLINPADADAVGFMYLWSELKMYEGSTVAFGANSLTPYMGVKSGNKDSLLIKLNNRIDLLTKQVRDGKQTDECLEFFDMQAAQLKQITKELFSMSPDKKDTLTGRRNNSTVEGAIDIKQLLNLM